jgi:hypothetical protein
MTAREGERSIAKLSSLSDRTAADACGRRRLTNPLWPQMCPKLSRLSSEPYC